MKVSKIANERGLRFDARTQKEGESIEDFVDYFHPYCDALGLDDDDALRFFIAFLNPKSRRRTQLVADRLSTWADVHSVLLRRGSREEKKMSRRKLENRKWKDGEDFVDFAADCFGLAKKAFSGDSVAAESMAIDYFTKGLPDVLIDRAEQKDTDDIWILADYVSEQAEKLKGRGINLFNKTSQPQPNRSSYQGNGNPSRPPQRTGYSSGIQCDNCGMRGHLTQNIRSNSG